MTEHNVRSQERDGNLIVRDIEGEPRIRDLDLAERLGFTKSTNIRNLIKRHRASLEAMGPLFTVKRVINGGEATENHLNRKQAIFITAKSDTPAATDITIEIIERFDAYERGLIVQATPAPSLSDIPQRDAALWLDLIREARRLYGRVAAKSMWLQSPLPQPAVTDEAVARRPRWNQKITPAQAEEIRKEYHAGKVTVRALAAKHSVSHMTIWRIVSGGTDLPGDQTNDAVH